MKVLALMLMLAGVSNAGEIEAQLAPASLSISSLTYTTAVSSLTRNGYYQSIVISNPASNPTLDSVYGHVGSCASTAVSTSSVKGPFVFVRGANALEVELTEPECLWLMSTSTQSITIQAIRRKK